MPERTDLCDVSDLIPPLRPRWRDRVLNGVADGVCWLFFDARVLIIGLALLMGAVVFRAARDSHEDALQQPARVQRGAEALLHQLALPTAGPVVCAKFDDGWHCNVVVQGRVLALRCLGRTGACVIDLAPGE